MCTSGVDGKGRKVYIISYNFTLEGAVWSLLLFPKPTTKNRATSHQKLASQFQFVRHVSQKTKNPDLGLCWANKALKIVIGHRLEPFMVGFNFTMKL